MIRWIVESIRANPELAVFLTLALGFAIGRIRLGGFSLGNVVGTLLAGVLVGQLGVDGCSRYQTSHNAELYYKLCYSDGKLRSKDQETP